MKELNIILKNLKNLFEEITNNINPMIIVSEKDDTTYFCLKSGRKELFFYIYNKEVFINTDSVRLSSELEEKYNVKNHV